MDRELLSEIGNKLTAPKIVLERLSKGEKVPREFFEVALKDLKELQEALQRSHSTSRNQL